MEAGIRMHGVAYAGLVPALDALDFTEPLTLHPKPRHRGALSDDAGPEAIRRRGNELRDAVACADERSDSEPSGPEPLGETVNRDRSLGMESSGQCVAFGEVPIRAVMHDDRSAIT